MFIGREQELQELNQRFTSENFEFLVLYGRRRIGKTSLIREFILDKKAIYFMGVESNAKQNLDNFNRCIRDSLPNFPAGSQFSTFQDALEYLFSLSVKDRLILVIDEYPYVARADKSLASTLQRLIDEYQQRSKLFFILCGSSMAYMEDQVLAYKSPLYGRRTWQKKLLPLSFEECCHYLRPMPPEDRAIAYGMVGGTPQYLLQIDPLKSLEENIKSIFLNPTALLFDEPVNLFKQEVREPALYTAIMTAIAGGATRLSEIAGKIGESSSVCAAYLRQLIDLDLIQKETPYGEKSSRKSLYSIIDPLFRFWYRFILNNSSLISRGAVDPAYQRIAPYLPDYMGSVFEEICKEYLWKLLLSGKSPILFHSLGRWWGTNPTTRQQEEIDIIGLENKSTAIFAECKWTHEKVDLKVLETLIRRSQLFPIPRTHYFLFAKNGFTNGCQDKAHQLGNVTLVGYEELMATLFGANE